MKLPVLMLAVASLMAGAALAQNTKGTGAEGETTTRTKPLPPVISSQSLDSRHRAEVPSGTSRGNPAATEAAQPDRGSANSSPSAAQR
ncbi:MAG: hypothetical protein AB7Q01_02420 [Gammaproteobacteria bacterium]